MIAKNTVAAIKYCLKNDAGEELDRAEANKPLSYLHGHGQIVPGLEKALEGLKEGDKAEVALSPAEGYGELNPELKMTIGKSQFPEGANPAVGMQFGADVDGHERVFTVLAVEGDQVTVDGNHPLAGQSLNFSVEVLELREATPEELEHGHSHDGHHHH